MPGRKRYEPDCGSCKLAKSEEVAFGGLVELPGDWIVAHYEGPETFLGWLCLQPRYHRVQFSDLGSEELAALGPNIHTIRERLAGYWKERFEDDGLRRIYFAHFSETAHDDPTPHTSHMHLHVIPRLESLDLVMRKPLGEGSAIDPWEIRRAAAHKDFPTRYSRSHRDYEDNVAELMDYLRAERLVA